MLYKEFLTPKPYQIRARKFGVRNRYCILALAMRLGKSFCALSIWNRVGGNLLVVCPSYLVVNWEAEIKKVFGEAGPMITVIKKGSDVYFPVDSEITIISYDLAQGAEILFEWADVVIADEAHLLKTMTAKRTEAFHKFVYENSIKRLILLSGTPIKNRVSEYYSLLCLMNYSPPKPMTTFLDKYPDQITFSDHFSFRSEFKMPVWKNGRQIRVTVVNWDGLKNWEQLRAYLKPFYLRIKDDVLGIEEEDISIQISDIADNSLLEDFTKYFKAPKKQKIKLDENGKTVKQKKVVNTGSVESRYKARAALKKAPITVKYAKDILDQCGKVVVFTDQTEACHHIASALKVEAITGKMSPVKRFKMERDFQTGKTNAIVATIQSFSTGKDLTAARDVVFNDYPWVPGDLDQAKARVKGPAQKFKVRHHFIFGSPQDKYIWEVIEEKRKVIAKVVDSFSKKTTKGSEK